MECSSDAWLSHFLNFRQSEQLFVWFGGQQKGISVSKQRMDHWIVDAMLRAYQVQDVPCPLGVRAHSTCCIADTSAVAHGSSREDICRAGGLGYTQHLFCLVQFPSMVNPRPFTPSFNTSDSWVWKRNSITRPITQDYCPFRWALVMRLGSVCCVCPDSHHLQCTSSPGGEPSVFPSTELAPSMVTVG